MTTSLGNKNPFMGRYKEIEILFDDSALGVEADGLLPSGSWENILVAFDVNCPEEYAHGVYSVFQTVFPTIPLTVKPGQLLSSEGWRIGEPD